jgi:hypothetical protein
MMAGEIAKSSHMLYGKNTNEATELIYGGELYISYDSGFISKVRSNIKLLDNKLADDVKPGRTLKQRTPCRQQLWQEHTELPTQNTSMLKEMKPANV